MLSDSGTHATLLTVRNMDRAVRFYTEVLGGKLLQRAEGEMKDFWASVKVARSEFWLVSPAEKEKRELAYSVFIVKDIRATAADLKSKGVRFSRAERDATTSRVEGPIGYSSMGASAFFKDTEGNLLMLWQAP